ncbi:fimbria/pilus periplasmic chaperone [Burkholderia sp. 4701]|nr:fimbria/pilus periplasmic chaperone [Burkholderia sp. 4701]MXN80627.1 fimbria/pilus periplasmic chaperone [Burkholderia sp. 4812]
MMIPISSSLFRRLSLCACAMLACVAQQAAASVIVSGTRVIYPAGDREVTVKIDNNGTQPALVQTWLDDGDVRSRPGTAKVPFVLMPPVFRIDPGKGQTVRIVYTGEPLPQDDESVFWLNVLDVPPRVEETRSTTALQLAFRSRIKLFFRPVGLDADGAVAAAKQVKWSLAPAPDGKGHALRATNPSPFNVVVLSARVAHGGHTFVIVDGAMVPPRQSRVLPLDAPLPALPPGTKLDYSTINDFGTGVQWESVVDDAR